MRKLLVFVLTIVAFSGFMHNSVKAQDTSQQTSIEYSMPTEHIKSFHSDIQIQKDGKIQVQEIIIYDFKSQYKHGIFRDIPYIKQDSETKKKYKLEYKVISVKDENGIDYKYGLSDSNDAIHLKIGDPNTTITGEHVYVITFSVSGALGYFNENDELYWNVTGTEWNVPIVDASATISLPSSSFTKTLCYTGAYGSTNSNCSITSEGLTATSNATLLSAYQGLTIVAAFPKDTVAVLKPEEIIEFYDTPFGRVFSWASIIGLFVGILYWYFIYPFWIVIKWYLYGRDPKSTTGKVSAWFDAPKTADGRTLRPAETGVLIDETANFADISSTILDLAQRGYYKIQERKKDDFYFVKKGEWATDSSLLPYEKKLIRGILGYTNEARIKDKKLYTTIVSVKEEMYINAVKHGYFPENPEKIRGFYTGVAIAAVFTVNIPLFFSALIFGRSMSRRTEAGVAATNVSVSLKNFLSSQERQLEFQAKNQMMFEKLLPYAVAFGVEDIWAERFKDLNLKEPEWYSGYNSAAFTSHTFVHSLSSSFNKVESSATPPHSSSSSSGFSGGSSGGGGGGGGGGSW